MMAALPVTHPPRPAGIVPAGSPSGQVQETDGAPFAASLDAVSIADEPPADPEVAAAFGAGVAAVALDAEPTQVVTAVTARLAHMGGAGSEVHDGAAAIVDQAAGDSMPAGTLAHEGPHAGQVTSSGATALSVVGAAEAAARSSDGSGVARGASPKANGKGEATHARLEVASPPGDGMSPPPVSSAGAVEPGQPEQVTARGESDVPSPAEPLVRGSRSLAEADPDVEAAPARASFVGEGQGTRGRGRTDDAVPAAVARPPAEGLVARAGAGARDVLADSGADAPAASYAPAAALGAMPQGSMESGGGSDASHERPAPPQPAVAPRAAMPPVTVLLPGADTLAGAVGVPGPALVTSYALVSPEDRAENVGRLVQSMRVLVRDGVSEATVRLRPEHLGEVSIVLRVDGRSVSAVVRTDAAQVREWLQTQHDALRHGLAQQGLSLDRLEVEPDGRRERQEAGDGESRHTRRRRDEAGARFDVLV